MLLRYLVLLFFLLLPSLLFGDFTIEGELKQWHRVTLTFDGPESSEDATPNPFLDYRLEVTFKQGNASYQVPGYFAADGQASETSAKAGNKWRVHFMPEMAGEWTFKASFRTGDNVAISDSPSAGTSTSFDGTTGRFTIRATDKALPDIRAQGKLTYVGKRYLQFQESGQYYLKSGPDSPETFLAFEDFDDTYSHNPNKQFLKDWAPHLQDWRAGDPTWQGGKGKAIIGAVNYISSQRMNVIYFLTQNIIGDGQDVWPYTNYDERFRFDCSKLDQWEIVFSQMTKMGIVSHFITQETENDQLHDGGELGPERKIYYRELIARFAHHPGLIWNLGEENTNTTAQQKDFANYFKSNDPYQHPTALHTHTNKWEDVYGPLLGDKNLDVLSFQTRDKLKIINNQTQKWIQRSATAGHPWVFFLDEPGIAWQGVEPDNHIPNNQAAMRKYTLWGNLMAGGAGVEWYFGYELPHSDLNCEDWRSRSNMWAYSRHALDMFQNHLPFTEMLPANYLTSDSRDYVLAQEGQVYAVYFPEWDNNQIDLREHGGTYSISWYNPRTGDGPHTGEKLKELYPRRRVGSISTIEGGDWRALGSPPYDFHEDWLVLVRKLP